MKIFRTGAYAAAMVVIAGAALSAPVKLTPANPQPSGLKQGLSVVYAEPGSKIRSLNKAKLWVEDRGRPGKPLRGLDYRDTDEGDPVMTATDHYNVAAAITGYIKFDAPGVYTIEMHSNDGVEAKISGETVGYEPQVTSGCEAHRRIDVEVPSAGWYDFSTLYFQKNGTSCLMMKWGKDGQKLSWVPNNAFGYK